MKEDSTNETFTRNTLTSRSSSIKKLSHLPVIVDPSHASECHGWLNHYLWLQLRRADGLMIEVHNDPANALSDGAQSLLMICLKIQ